MPIRSVKPASEVFHDIVSAIADAQRDDAGKLADEIRDRVSVPVGYRIGPRGGTYKIRSKPGEPPRKDTGKLQSSIATETIEVGDQVATAVTVGVPYAEPLQESMDRPITDDELDAFESLILDSVVDAING